jgi:hypothetical protein
MPAPCLVRLPGAFETLPVLLVRACLGAFLLSALGFAAGVDVTPGMSVATAGLLA